MYDPFGTKSVSIDQVYSNVKIHPHTKPRHRRFRLERRRRMLRFDWSTNRSVNRRCRRFETPVYTQIFLGRDSKKLSVIFQHQHRKAPLEKEKKNQYYFDFFSLVLFTAQLVYISESKLLKSGYSADNFERRNWCDKPIKS